MVSSYMLKWRSLTAGSGQSRTLWKRERQHSKKLFKSYAQALSPCGVHVRASHRVLRVLQSGGIVRVRVCAPCVQLWVHTVHSPHSLKGQFARHPLGDVVQQHRRCVFALEASQVAWRPPSSHTAPKYVPEDKPGAVVDPDVTYCRHGDVIPS